MAQSMQVNSFQNTSSDKNFDTSKIPNVKLPKLDSAGENKKAISTQKRFNSVKTREPSMYR